MLNYQDMTLLSLVAHSSLTSHFLKGQKQLSEILRNWKCKHFVILPIIFAGWFATSYIRWPSKFLHHFYASNGAIELTVIEMESTALKGKCIPIIVVQEVPFFINDPICLSAPIYANLDLGSKVKTLVLISPFGIEVVELEN